MKRRTKNYSLPALYGIGILCVTVTLALMSILLATVSSFTENPTSLTEMLSLLSLFLTGAFFGYLFPRVFDTSAQNTFAAALISVLLMLIAGVILRSGMLSASVFLNHFAFLGIVALTANISVKRGARRKRRY